MPVRFFVTLALVALMGCPIPEDTGSDADSDTDSSTVSDTDADTDSDSAPDADSELDTDADPDTDTEPDTDTGTEPDLDVDTEPDTDVDTEPDTDVDTEPDTDVDTEPDTDADTEPDTDADTDPDTSVCLVPADGDLGSALGIVHTGNTCNQGDDLEDRCLSVAGGTPDEGFLWTAPYGGTFTFWVHSDDYPPGLTLHEPCDPSPQNCVDSTRFEGTYAGQQRILREGDTVLIGVQGYGGNCGDYEVEVEDETPICDADVLEPNDRVSEAVGLPASAADLTIHQGDPDYFTVELDVGEAVDLLADGNSLDLRLYDDNLWEVAGGEGSSWAFQDLFYVNTTGRRQTFLLTVNARSIACTDYSLTSALFDSCIDPSEPNDVWNNAAPLGAGVTDYAVSSSDPDFFETTVPPGDTLVLQATRDGDARIELVDVLGSPVSTMRWGHEFGFIEHTNTSSSDVIWKTHVWTESQTCDSYSIVSSLRSEGTCVEDDVTNNDTEANAAFLASDTLVRASVTDGDSDWYTLTLEPRTFVRIFVDFEHDRGDIDLDSNTGESESTDDDEFLYFSNASGVPFTVTFEVSLYDGACNDYTLMARY